ncbi:universal stress protein [Halorubrum sp. JWXQ-INN 858]|uniref:universal stress protein n=1 Tax=Halorubrum sp. JWXQ-INN 858 TaxID=2690782 RepID=UPI00135818CC|nr:universal stress protein [Halorubrum sp. JWXQ-INN 858]MWV64174.1 universal stress protein [Halorubrum sp. JWXQ-INN 858]
MTGSDTDDADAASAAAEDGRDGIAAELEEVVARAAGELATVSDARLASTPDEPASTRVSSILVAVGGGPHTGATVDLARRIADRTDAWIELFHVVPATGDSTTSPSTDDRSTDDPTPRSTDDRSDDAPSTGEATDPGVATPPGVSTGGAVEGPATDVGAESPDTTPLREEGDRLLDAAGDRIAGFDRVDRWIVEGETPAAGIVEQSAYYDAVVVGSPTAGTVGRFVFGSTTDTVVEEATVPVVVVEAEGSTALLDDD